MASEKTALRLAMRVLRRRLAAESPQAAESAAARLPLDALPPFDIFALYLAQGAELDAGPLARRLTQAGGTPSLPAAAGRDETLTFRVWTPGEPLAPDAFGIPAPPSERPACSPDIVIAPLLAFDRQGGRLGQGAGHYDRALANLRAVKRVFVLGLAYAGQELPEIPMEPHDQRLDAILTETAFIPALN